MYKLAYPVFFNGDAGFQKRVNNNYVYRFFKAFVTDVAKMTVVWLPTACRIVIFDFSEERAATICRGSEFASLGC